MSLENAQVYSIRADAQGWDGFEKEGEEIRDENRRGFREEKVKMTVTLRMG